MNRLQEPLLLKCPECGGALEFKELSHTLVGYGGYRYPHDHDDNCCQTVYRCENGHDVSERQQNFCPVPDCGWVGKTDCFCSPIGIQVWEENKPIKLVSR